MHTRFIAAVSAALAIASASGPILSGQAKNAKAYAQPRTAWGDPDLQGSFTNTDESGTPFERPAEFAGKRLEDVTSAELEKAIEQRNARKREVAPGLGGRETGAGPIHWFEDYNSKNSRAWLVTDPPDGRVPPQTDDARQRAAAAAARRRGGNGFDIGPFDGPEDLTLYDRCISRGIPGSMMPAIYGNSYQIVQGPGFVAIRYEMVHETRIIPLDNRAHVSKRIPLYMGDPRGHWEGDTLVVETTNFVEAAAFRGASKDLKLTERFKPVGPKTVEWSATLDDARTWTRPWTFAMNLTRDPSQPVFEYACHEGNIGLAAILSAARVEEAKSAPRPAPASPQPQGAPQAAAPAIPLPAGEVVVGSGNYSPIVTDLDKAIEFYGGLLGLTVPPAPSPGPRPYNTDPALLKMFGMPSAQLRFVTARIPGAAVGVEMVEVKGLDRKPVRPRPQDPGGTTLILMVRDIDAAFAPLKKAGVPVVTPGGAPLAFGQNNAARGVIVSDPDGHYVELLQPSPLPETTAPAESNIIGARVRVTVADTDQTVKLYKDLLQFQPQVGQFGNIALLDLMGLKGAQLRLTNAQVPGSPLRLEFIELKGTDGTPVRPRLQDPGAARLQLRLKDLDATMTKLKAAGFPVISTGGEPATLNGGVRAFIMPDPNNLYFVLMQAAPPRANQ